MKAFHNNSLIKELYLTRLNKHYKADEIIKGQYWKNGKGCAVGCTIHSSKHKNYESELGIPICLAYLQDRIFEGLTNELAKKFPLQFLSAINVGSDLKNVSKLFMIWVLTDSKYGALQYAEEKKVIQDVADAISKDMVTPVSVEEWEELRKNAYDAYPAASIAASNSAASNSAVYASVYAYSVAAYSVVSASAFASGYSNAVNTAANACISNNTISKWYIAASKKLIELLEEAN